MKISVAMCTYDGEKYLPEQLSSIAAQTRLPDELIVCDDNSSDGTIQLLGAFAGSAPFPVRIERNPATLGSTKNFEKAIMQCTGDVIALSDQDDVWHADKLELLEKAFLARQETGAVFSNGNVVDEVLSLLGYTLWDGFWFTGKHRTQFREGKAFDVLLNHNVVTGAALAFRSMLRDAFVPIPSAWVHDAWIAIMISVRHPIDFVDRCLLDYRQHPSQQIGGRMRSGRENIALARSVTDYRRQIEQYGMLAECLKREGVATCVWKVNDKIEHLEARSSYYTRRLLAKLVPAFHELIRGRYHKYSRGCQSCYKDLFLIW